MLVRGPDGRVDYTPEEGEIVVLRRPHACGADRFAVTLAGLDVRLSCAGCGQRVILTRDRLRGRVVDVDGRVAPQSTAALHIDHVLMAVSDLDAGAAELDSRFGLAATGGGRHPGWGTANRIVPLGDSYLELVAVVDPAEAAASAFGTLVGRARHGTLIGWAARTEQLDAVAIRLGISVHAGSRQAPDGTWTRWRMAGVEQAIADPSLPFFIEWAQGTPLPGRAAARHREPVTGLTRLTLAGNARRLSRWIGLHSMPIDVRPGPPGVVAVAVGSPATEIVIRSA